MDNNINNESIVENNVEETVTPVLQESPVETLQQNSNNNISKKNSKLVSIILTIILGLFAVYAAGYTVYYVFLIPATIPDEEPLENNVSELFKKGIEALKLVPTLNNFDSAYEYNPTIYDDIDNETLFYTVLELYTEDNDVYEVDDVTFGAFKDEYCSEGDNECYAVSYEELDKLVKVHYGINLVLVKEDYIFDEENKCLFEVDQFYCVFDNKTDSYSGKVGIIETIKDTDINLTIYESALFVNNLIIENNLITMEDIMLLPNGNTSFQSEYSMSYSENYEEEILNEFETRKRMYKHEFKFVDGEYVWIKTTPVTKIDD